MNIPYKMQKHPSHDSLSAASGVYLEFEDCYYGGVSFWRAWCHRQSSKTCFKALKNKFFPVLCFIIWIPELIFPVSSLRGHCSISAGTVWFIVGLSSFHLNSLHCPLVCDLETAAVLLSKNKMR